MYSCRLESAYDLSAIADALPGSYPYLLDSATSGPLGQCSLLLRANGEQLSLATNGDLDGINDGAGFLSSLESWYQKQKRSAYQHAEWPFIGGWFLYLGYELAAEIEPVVPFPSAGDGFPVAFASRCDGVVYSRPSEPGVLHLVAESSQLLQCMQAELTEVTITAATDRGRLVQLQPDDPLIFKNAVSRIHDYILDGDVFQVNLSRGWEGAFEGPVNVRELYQALRQNNPAPFAGLVRWQDYVLMSSSPERLVEVRDGVVQSRPIAGTRPRGADVQSDQQLSRELLAHPKERAEHVMLIDLERNDLGRVCEAGSVDVNELMVVETYEHVHHIVSNVRGQLRNDVSPVDVIRAVFPGGTITGCPKVRCMEIIAELERHGRSFYTGSMGYLGLDGSMDLNILIRSMLVHDRHISFRTGAGIVADSIADNEVTETEDKARGLLNALGAPDSKEILRTASCLNVL